MVVGGGKDATANPDPSRLFMKEGRHCTVYFSTTFNVLYVHSMQWHLTLRKYEGYFQSTKIRKKTKKSKHYAYFYYYCNNLFHAAAAVYNLNYDTVSVGIHVDRHF